MTGLFGKRFCHTHFTKETFLPRIRVTAFYPPFFKGANPSISLGEGRVHPG